MGNVGLIAKRCVALASGIVGVWVNGERVWKETGPTGAYPGVFIENSGILISAELSTTGK